MINIIAACGLGLEIGHKNQLLCHLPDDLKYFKEKTQGNICVFGRKTFESVGKLPNRHNIVLTHKKNLTVPNGVLVYHSVEDILKEYNINSNKEVELFICGGENVYKQFLPYADKIYLTIIDTVFDHADTHFPQFNLLDFKPVKNVVHEKDDKHKYKFHFVEYHRRNKQN